MPTVEKSSATLGEWFHLKDPTRTTFELDPERDAEFWCGDPEIRDRLIEALRDGLDNGVPHLILFGEYGTGKTHALFHCKWTLEQQERTPRAHCVRIEWSGFSSRTRFIDVYRETLDRLGLGLVAELIRDHWQTHGRFRIPGDLGDFLEQDSDLQRALLIIAQTNELFVFRAPNAKVVLAWRWLKGLALNQSQRRELNVSASLVEEAKPTRLVNLLRMLGYFMARRRDGGRKLILMYDEGEQVDELRRSRDALNSFASATRALFDRSQSEVGVILAFFGARLEESALIRPDTHSRLDQDRQVISLPPLATMEKRRDFLDNVLRALVSPGQGPHYPFDAAARNFFAEHCGRFGVGLKEERFSFLTGGGEPTARTVLVALEAVTRAAYNLRERKITTSFMRNRFDLDAS
ncbi:hypothetical protein ACLESD_28530 [Pyxidicoccus sp. 3LFB2]